MKLSKETKINILLLVFVIIIFFTIFEIMLRVVWKEPGVGGWPLGMYVPDENLGFKHKPNYFGPYPGLLYKDITVKINSKGVRGAEVNYENDRRKLRVLGLGDSITFGVGVNEEDTFLNKLENEFNAQNYNVEVINASVASYQFEQIYNQFFIEGIKYDPDIVILGIALNDASPIDIKDLQKRYSDTNLFSSLDDFKFFIGRVCKVCKFTYLSAQNIYFSLDNNAENYNNKYFEQVYSYWRGENLNNFKKRLIEMNEYITENNKKLIVVVFPYTQQFKHSLNYGRLPQNEIKWIAKEHHIDYVDVLPYLDDEHYLDYYLLGDNAHLSELGNEIVAQVLYLELMDKGFIK